MRKNCVRFVDDKISLSAFYCLSPLVIGQCTHSLLFDKKFSCYISLLLFFIIVQCSHHLAATLPPPPFFFPFFSATLFFCYLIYLVFQPSRATPKSLHYGNNQKIDHVHFISYLICTYLKPKP